MKIDTDLRSAIRSAEKAQPIENREMRSKREQDAISALFKLKPITARIVKDLSVKARKAYDAYNKAREKLCKEYGLQESNNSTTGFCFSNCGDGQKQFAKIGGKMTAKYTRWKFDDVMNQLSAATPAEGKKIIKALGINWE